MTGLRFAFYGAVILAASVFQCCFLCEQTEAPESEDLVARGRQVYISEGCIHCHSQYVRPVGRDMELWGTRTTPERALSQEPVLIGNRRQGPDLANVGQRRNAGWNRLHLIEPSVVVPGSRMPSYRHLFKSDAAGGEALLAYLNSLQHPTINSGNPVAHQQHEGSKL